MKKPTTKEVGCRLLLVTNGGLFGPDDAAIQFLNSTAEEKHDKLGSKNTQEHA